MERWDWKQMDRRWLWLFGLVFAALTAVLFFVVGDAGKAPAPLVVKKEIGEESQRSGHRIFVYVAGAVAKPGVYEISSMARTYEAVEAAGGFLAYAEEEVVDLAAPVTDGMTIHVPLRPDRVDIAAPGEAKVNLNTATLLELRTLPGVGESTAAKIVEWREKHGGFKKVEDLMEVPSIGQGRFAKVADRITI